MSEFFLELFSEEIPANLQKNARKNLLQNFKDFFRKKDISFNKEISFSTPNRLLILFDSIKPEISQKEEEIRGPKIDAPEKALNGFLRSNNLENKDLYKKENEKGVFYFAKKPAKTIKVFDLLNENIPLILDKTGVDPAIASTVLLTTITDIFGFFTFLGLGSIYLL